MNKVKDIHHAFVYMSSHLNNQASKQLNYLKIGSDEKQQTAYDIGSTKFRQIYTDYPIVAYVLSANEIVIVNLLEPNQK